MIRPILLCAVLALPGVASAQIQLAAYTFGSAIDHTEGPIHVQATLGQAAAGTLEPPPYRVEAGFWLALAGDAATPIEVDPTLPDGFRLEGNYPNPFNPATTIRYTLAQAGPVRLAVYDALGREVALLVAGPRPPGRHEVVFEAGTLPSGLYFYRLETDQVARTGTMLLLK